MGPQRRHNLLPGFAGHLGICDLDQLYYLKKDPQEKNNLANKPEYAEKLKEMKALLVEHIKKTGRSFGEFNQAEK